MAALAMAADVGEVNGMAARKQTRRTPTRRKKQRSWRIPKVLLFLSYSAALVALGSIFFMKTELQRFKGAGRGARCSRPGAGEKYSGTREQTEERDSDRRGIERGGNHRG